MAKRWVTLKMPELKDVPIEQAVALYLASSHCKELQVKEQKSVKNSSLGKSELR